MNKKNINSKNLILILALILITLVGIAGTYALFTWTSTENTELTMSIGDVADVTFINGPDITTSLTPVFNYTDGEKTTIQIKKRNENSSGIKYTINLNITSIDTPLIDSTFKYKLLKEKDIVAEGDFSGTSNGTVIELENSYLFNTTNFTFYLYIDGNEENSSDMMNSKFTGTISMTAENTDKITAAQTITNLYLNNKTGTVPNYNVNYNVAAIYDNGDDDATTNSGLINDRLGGTTVDLDGGNIRYYGAKPHNYIYFNCTEYPSTGCEKWRIIGVFDGKLKLLGNSIGNYSWDNKDTTTGAQTNNGSNNWSTARLMKLLNPGYDSEPIGGSLYYNSKAGVCYAGVNNDTTECNFTTTGIKNNETRSRIANATWNLSSYSSNVIYSHQLYRYEIGNTVWETNPPTWTGKIALTSASDWGYGADLNVCTDTLGEYSSTNCANNNYLKSNYNQWLLNPRTVNSYEAWVAYWTGYLNANINTNTILTVRPTLYLDADQVFEGGDGSENNPYKLLA